jgi:hypothetical protein
MQCKPELTNAEHMEDYVINKVARGRSQWFLRFSRCENATC